MGVLYAPGVAAAAQQPAAAPLSQLTGAVDALTGERPPEAPPGVLDGVTGAAKETVDGVTGTADEAVNAARGAARRTVERVTETAERATGALLPVAPRPTPAPTPAPSRPAQPDRPAPDAPVVRTQQAGGGESEQPAEPATQNTDNSVGALPAPRQVSRLAGRGTPDSSRGGAPAAGGKRRPAAARPADTERKAVAGRPASGVSSAPARASSVPAAAAVPAPEDTDLERLVRSLPREVPLAVAALALLALVVALRGFVATLHARRREDALRGAVGALQQALLPDVPERVGPLSVSVAYRPADGPGAGGDFFDVFELPDGRVCALIGDVAGHGRQALSLTAFVHYTLRAYINEGAQPREALRRASEALGDDLDTAFTTALVAIYDPQRSQLTWASAGHPNPVLVGADLRLSTAACAPPIGMGMRSGQRQTTVHLPTQVMVCLHTDGLTEARTPDGEQLCQDGLLRLLELHNGQQPNAAGLLEQLRREVASAPDDMAAVLLRVDEPTGAPAAVVSEQLLVAPGEPAHLLEEFVADCGIEPAQAVNLTRRVRELQAAGAEACVTVYPQSGQVELHGIGQPLSAETARELIAA